MSKDVLALSTVLVVIPEQMSEEMRFKLEMRRKKLEEAREAQRLEAEKERELRVLELEAKPETRWLKAEKIRETKRLEVEKEAKMHEREEDEKNRIFELEKMRKKVNSPHGLRRGDGVKEDTIDSHMVMSLKLIPEIGEKKVT